jgi:hypothetical protein
MQAVSLAMLRMVLELGREENETDHIRGGDIPGCRIRGLRKQLHGGAGHDKSNNSYRARE